MPLAEQSDAPPAPRPTRLTTHDFHQALVEAGVVRDGESIRRIVIDANVGELVVIHVERYGDTRLLDVVRTLDGIEVRECGRTDPAPGVGRQPCRCGRPCDRRDTRCCEACRAGSGRHSRMCMERTANSLTDKCTES